MTSATPLLDTFATPDDLRKLPDSQLRQVADELRAETISAVAVDAAFGEPALAPASVTAPESGSGFDFA